MYYEKTINTLNNADGIDTAVRNGSLRYKFNLAAGGKSRYRGIRQRQETARQEHKERQALQHRYRKGLQPHYTGITRWQQAIYANAALC